MKKVLGAIFAISMALSIVFIGESLSANGQSMQGTVTTRHRRRGVASRTYRGGKYVVHKTKRGTKWTAHKVKRGTKWTYHKTKRGTKWTAHKTKRGTKSIFHKTKKAVY